MTRLFVAHPTTNRAALKRLHRVDRNVPDARVILKTADGKHTKAGKPGNLFEVVAEDPRAALKAIAFINTGRAA